MTYSISSKTGQTKESDTLPVQTTSKRRGSISRLSGDTLEQQRSRRSASNRSLLSTGDDLSGREAKIKIDSIDDKKRRWKKSSINAIFRFNLEMSIRVAIGVLLASIVLTRNRDGNNLKQWYFFPEWYYLGGLSYCAVAVIFSAQKNVGATIRQVVQAFNGVGMALLFNIALFSFLDVKLFNPEVSDDPTLQGYIKIEKTFSGNSYYMNPDLFYKVLPAIMGFTIVVLILPMEANTKKFALANNLYFVLTIIDPSNPEAATSTELKTKGDSKFETTNILRNLTLYFVVGIIGTLISLMVMFIPYPVYAIRRLQQETKGGGEDIVELLNIIIDAYCFKNKNLEHMNFLKLELHRKFNHASDRQVRMRTYLDDIWWEQLFGFHVFLDFNRSIIEKHVELLTSLIIDLRMLANAMQLETYANLHVRYLKVLQKEIYSIQLRSGDLLNEINDSVSKNLLEMDLPSASVLKKQMENTLEIYRKEQVKALHHRTVTKRDVEGNFPLNLFLFSLDSFCTTLVSYQEIHNQTKHQVLVRAEAFIRVSQEGFFSMKNFSRLRIVSALKVAVAIFIGVILAVFVYRFKNTTPAAIAYVMSNHIGASFSLTVNRVGGVVAGSVVPSVFQFFITLTCTPPWLNTLLTNFCVGIWVTLSMYVFFSQGYAAYAGLVSAFVSVGILLKPSVDCALDTTTSVALDSYSTLAMTSMGIIVFVLVEIILCPESAMSLLRQNIRESMQELKETFDILFTNHRSSKPLDELTKEELKLKLQVVIPNLLRKQSLLLKEANSEPQLWKPAFSYSKYNDILDSSYRLLNVNALLLKLATRYNLSMQHELPSEPELQISEHIYNEGNPSSTVVDEEKNARHSQSSYNREVTPAMRRWLYHSAKFKNAVTDTFDTIRMVFSSGFFYADSDETAVFLQMKEAFRMADTDGSGEIDSGEVQGMLENILLKSGAVKATDLDKHVEKFMEIVDEDNSGSVSFDEFLHALDNGLKVEVEVYNRKINNRTLLNSRKGSLRSILEGANENTRTHSGSNDRENQVSKRSNQASPVYSALSSPMRREYQVLNVQEFSLLGIAEDMRKAYVDWLVDDKKFKVASMEELLLLSCLVSGAESFGRQLTKIEEIIILG